MPDTEPVTDATPAEDTTTTAQPAEAVHGSRPRHAALVVEEGEGVVLSGTITLAETEGGTLKLDLLTLAENRPPELVHQVVLEESGAFSVETPRAFGTVHLVAYLDRDDNGPSNGEPVVALGVEVGTENIEGLVLEPAVGADLGRLAPGAPPPESAGPPPTEPTSSVETESQAAAGQ